MSNYVQTTFFAPKDLLLSGNPAKLIKGADVDPELAAISIAIATKYDSTTIGSAPVGFASGSAGAPGIFFVGDSGTGVYRPAASQVALAGGAIQIALFTTTFMQAPAFSPNGSTVPANGLFLPAANTVGLSSASTLRASVDASGHWIFAAPSSGATQVADFNMSSGTFSATGNPAIRIANSNASGQTPIDFFINGSLSGRFRNDFAGNLSYVSLSSGIHSFWVGGDSGVGSNNFNVVSRANGGATISDLDGNLQVVGFRGTPLNTQGSNYTLTASDKGRTVNASATITVTVPNSVFSAGDVTAVSVGNGATVTIAQGSGVTLQWAGSGSTTGNRTLTGAGLATILFLTTSVGLISGAGLS